MVQIIEPWNCMGPNCLGSPEEREKFRERNADRGFVMGGHICRDACHNDPPGPCRGRNSITGEFLFPQPEPVPMTAEERRKRFEDFAREFLKRNGPDSLSPRPFDSGDKLPDATLGPRPDRLRPRIPSPFSPHPIESPPPVPNHLVGPDDGMSTEDRESKI